MASRMQVEGAHRELSSVDRKSGMQIVVETFMSLATVVW
jgi:hypothetical protein